MLCFVVVMQSFIMNSHEVSIHIHQGCFAGIGAIVRLPQCQWSKPDGYGKISQCITTTKHSKAKTVCIFLGIYCTLLPFSRQRYQDNCCYQDGDAMCHLARIVTTLLQQEGIAKIGQPKKSSDWHTNNIWNHYNDVIMGKIASQITSLTIVYSAVHSGADQRNHQSSASLAFHR